MWRWLHGSLCAVTETCAALQCEEGCRATHGGPACYCRAGYEPDAGGRCRDADECARDDTCAQLCHNTVGSYTCSCAPGYRLQGGRDCVPVNGECRFGRRLSELCGVSE